ncbi:MAG: hypothetical protein JOY78_00910 [Pseudonocardia sp.]|nr:hypothetical protein [Pseudonocardia sp.]
MIRKTAIVVGVGTAVLLGAAGTALASGSDTPPSASPAPSASAAPRAHKHQHRQFRGEYAQWTTFDKTTNTATVHHAIRGTISTVSSTSVSIKAADGATQTFAVGNGTKVHVKGDRKPDPGSMGQVKVGDRAAVVGTGSDTFTATHVLDRGATSQG